MFDDNDSRILNIVVSLQTRLFGIVAYGALWSIA